MNPMTLDEARAIVGTQDSSDPARALEAVAVVLRFAAISEPKLLGVAASLEQIAAGIDGSSEHAA